MKRFDQIELIGYLDSEDFSHVAANCEHSLNLLTNK